MPTIRQSANFDRSQLTPAPIAQPMNAPGPNSIVPDTSLTMSPFMHAAMPVSASTFDSLTRQFYRSSSIPTSRILPVSGQ